MISVLERYVLDQALTIRPKAVVDSQDIKSVSVKAPWFDCDYNYLSLNNYLIGNRTRNLALSSTYRQDKNYIW